MLKVRHLIEPTDFTIKELEDLFSLADLIIENPKKYSRICDGKILVTLFYEPSTRTRFSFEAAMMRLGGNILGFSDPNSSSTAKGENILDTIRIVSGYADIAVMRHPIEGGPKAASLYSKIPVINAGDGGHQHPTQTLTDLYTIRSKFGRLDNLKIGICGDLKYGRTTHSLVKAMSRYENNSFVFISPEELKMPKYICDGLDRQREGQYKEYRTIEEAIGEVDILYMTRVQRERFADLDEYERVKDSCILTVDKMKLAPEHMIVLHPLPRVNEIHPDVDEDKRACYFEQAENGMYVRMSLLMHLLDLTGDFYNGKVFAVNDHMTSVIEMDTCKNPKCITNHEPALRQRFNSFGDGTKVCDYCGAVL
ncbi:MAG: aspartate carbamoyltransferase [Clostridiales bacterium]|nr:aspartate carbamoyltransferase [Clostridiales bacterium]